MKSEDGARPMPARSTPASAVQEQWMAPRPLSLASACGAMLLWSSSALLIDRLSGAYRLSAIEISGWRVFIALPPLVVITALVRPRAFRIPTHVIPVLTIAGVVGIALSYVTWSASVHLNHPAVAAALSFSAPAFIAVGDRLFFHVRLNRVQIAAIGGNLVGCALAAGLTHPAALVHSPLGLLVGLGNGVTFSAYALLSRGIARTGRRDPLSVLLGMFFAGAASLLIWGLAQEGPRLVPVHLDVAGWLLLIGLGLGPTLIAYALFNHGLRHLPPTIASLVATMELPTVAVLALLLLGRAVSTTQWIGIALILVGVISIQVSARRQRE